MFGAHRTYHVTNGSSTSNRIILMASVSRDQIALCDRNCHKSAEHAMTMSGAIPTYLVPTRNRYGIIGPIASERLTQAAIREAITSNPLTAGLADRQPKHAIVTNSTYDGLCYNVARVEELLGASVDRLHFDEAWYGYARFNPIYRDRHAMHGDPRDHRADRPTVFATQSTHKLLTALSQASYIHVRDGRNPIPHGQFNETFMMHASTSPNYAIIASNDVAAAMMDGPGGAALTHESIEEAVAFRQMIARMNSEFGAKGDWFFECWQPDTVLETRTGRTLPFHDAPPELLASDPSCWVLRPGAQWHGFGNIEDGYCMLDPIKVSIVTPGVAPAGGLMPVGIPASVVTAYLDARGIVVEKTTDFTILFLFSIGITKGKWGSLVSALCDFKRDYDANLPLDMAIPSLAKAHGSRYAGMGLKDPDTMFAAMEQLGTTRLMSEAFSILPKPEMAGARLRASGAGPRRAGHARGTGRTHGRHRRRAVSAGHSAVDAGRERGPADGPVLGYLKALEAYDRRFPGFAHDTHGVEVEDGTYRVYCLTA